MIRPFYIFFLNYDIFTLFDPSLLIFVTKELFPNTGDPTRGSFYFKFFCSGLLNNSAF